MRRSALVTLLPVVLLVFSLALIGQRCATAQTQTPNALQPAASDDGVNFFESRIRPLLVANCYECHNSVDTAEGGLALDWRDAMQQGGESGSLLQSRDGTNLLLAVVKHEISGLEMPDGGKKLSAQEIADLEKWLQVGAPDPRNQPPSPEVIQAATSWEAQLERRRQWWSFRPVQPHSPPATDKKWPRDPIDNFVLAKMQQADLRPAPQADAETLARRLYLALTGLPPSYEQISKFVSDQGGDAYERLVDQLLQSEHFGERWSRHWMDWIRYADSHGSEGDPEIVGAHYYRDYLIRALNANVPYDQLVREHIAGDLIENPRKNEQLSINESLIGTAHWRFVFHGFAPTDALDEKVRFTDDAINVFSKTFMGLTVSCARCHNHKFDAISQADYYAAFGIVASARPGRCAIDLPEKLLQASDDLGNLKLQVRDSLIAEWQLITPEQLAERLGAAASPKAAVGTLGNFWHVLATAGQEEFPEKIRQLHERADSLKGGLVPGAPIADWQFSVEQPTWNAYGAGLARSTEQAALPRFAPNVTPAGSFYIPDAGDVAIEQIHPSGVFSNLLSSKLPARLSSPDFQLDGDYKLHLLVYGDGDATSRYVIQDYPRNGTVFPVKKLASKSPAGWQWQEYDLTYWKGDTAHIELAHASDGPLLSKPNQRSRFAIRRAVILPADRPGPVSNPWAVHEPLIDNELFLASTTLSDATKAVHETINHALTSWKAGTLSDAQAMLLSACLTEGVLPNKLSDVGTAASLIEAYREAETRVPYPRRIPSLAEHRGSDQPLYDRGDHQKPLDLVPRRFLEAIDATPYNTTLSGRLQLAKDVLRRDNPLTSRVIVNRLWHHLFGRGIVATTDNFGALGEQPTHPELLDYLATEFRDVQRWQLKDMIRRIVLSSTWRQSSVAADPTATNAIDPNNNLWSHMPLRRLDAEAIRDALLVVSGKLDSQLFGPSVPGNTQRRSVYVRAKRNDLDPFLTTFDSPVPFSTKGRRDATNVPAQSLLLMNSGFVSQLARDLVRRVGASDQTDEQRANAVWKSVLAREPDTEELAAAKRFAAAQARSYEQQRAARSQFDQQLKALRSELAKLHTRAADTWKQNHSGDAASPVVDLPPPVWIFDKNRLGSSSLKGSAKLTDSGITLDGKGWLASPRQQQPLREKTLVAEVQLSNLTQRGGGVLTVQTIDGNTFDAIVFGEQKDRYWLAGSNHFARTEPFSGGTAETVSGTGNWIHLALTYKADDAGNASISLYRNGALYGAPYSKPIQEFAAGGWQVLIGLRHGTDASGNRPLKGTVRRAAVFDAALTPDQVGQEYRHANGPTLEEMLAALPAGEVERAAALNVEADLLSRHIADLPAEPEADQHWIDLAHSLFNVKEFIYVR